MSVRSRIVEIAEAEVGSVDWQKYQSDAAPVYPVGTRKSWCGIFVLWCYRQAGLISWRWKDGYGFIYRIGFEYETKSPKPGDVGYVAQPYQHHFLVKRVNGDTVECIDGNSGPTPGVVKERTRSLGDTSVRYFSIETLITERSDTEPAPALWTRTLRWGMEGADVLAWQEFLDDWRLGDGQPVLCPNRRSGFFDGYTYAGTLAFQKSTGLVVDALVGPKTRSKAGV